MVEKFETYRIQNGYGVAGYNEITYRYFEDEKGRKYGVENWRKTLAEKPYGEIAAYIQWGFTVDDKRMLAKLHKEGFQRKKIEDLLEDCNFHTMRRCFHAGRYREGLRS